MNYYDLNQCRTTSESPEDEDLGKDFEGKDPHHDVVDLSKAHLKNRSWGEKTTV